MQDRIETMKEVYGDSTEGEVSSNYLRSSGKLYDKTLKPREDGLLSTLWNFPLRGYISNLALMCSFSLEKDEKSSHPHRRSFTTTYTGYYGSCNLHLLIGRHRCVLFTMREDKSISYRYSRIYTRQ